MSKDTGGPAFPNAEINTQQRGHSIFASSWPGMNLRDYFAGQALAGTLSAVRININGDLMKALATGCYAAADAMIAERSKP